MRVRDKMWTINQLMYEWRTMCTMLHGQMKRCEKRDFSAEGRKSGKANKQRGKMTKRVP